MNPHSIFSKIENRNLINLSIFELIIYIVLTTISLRKNIKKKI